MKRLLSLIALGLLAAITLPGCAGMNLAGLADPLVRVAETVTDENTSAKGATAGMSSSDAANVLINRDYYGAVKAMAGAGKGEARAPLVEIEARDGQPITINAKSFKVYAPPAQGSATGLSLAAPREVESNSIKWFREIRRGLAEVFLPWRAVERNADIQQHRITTDAATRQTELGVLGSAVQGSRDVSGQVIDAFAPPKETTTTETPAPAPAAAP